MSDPMKPKWDGGRYSGCGFKDRRHSMHKGRKNRTVASYSSRLAWKKIICIQIYNLAMTLVFKLKRINYSPFCPRDVFISKYAVNFHLSHYVSLCPFLHFLFI